MKQLIKLPKVGEGFEIIPFEVSEDKKVFINYFGGVQAGFPSPAEDFIKTKLSLDERYLENPNNTYMVRVTGQSMYPTFQVDDILIVKADLDLQDNDIAIISINGDNYTVKRFNKKLNLFTPDNTEFSSINVDENDTVLLLGIVKHLVRDI
jgi:DNA polymerase V